MRIEFTLATVGTLLFAAGCADTPRQTYYGTDTIHGGQVMSSSTYPNSTYSSTTDSTVSPGFTTLEGCFMRRDQVISLT